MQQGEAEDFAEELAEDLPDGFPDDPAGLTGGTGEPAESRPSTGEPRVDAALGRLDELAGRPVTEHRAVFEDVHRRLRDVLGELDSRPPQAAGDGADAASRPGR